MDLTFQVPMQYCSLQHQTLFLSPVPSTTGHCFCLGSIPSFFLELFLLWSPLAYWAPTGRCPNQPGEFLFQYPINFPIPTVHGALKARILKWFAIPFSSGPHSQTSLPWPGHGLGWSRTAWLSFIELDKAVVLWSDWLVFCDYGFSASALWCPLAALTVLLGFLLPWTWGLFTAAPAKCSRCSLPWMRGIFSRPPLLTLNVE